jgi:hypothetical protein
MNLPSGLTPGKQDRAAGGHGRCFDEFEALFLSFSASICHACDQFICGDWRLNMKMDDDRPVQIDPSRQLRLDYGCAVTSDSTRGQTADRVLFYAEPTLARKTCSTGTPSGISEVMFHALCRGISGRLTKSFVMVRLFL